MPANIEGDPISYKEMCEKYLKNKLSYDKIYENYFKIKYIKFKE
jgi:hypothetical protein